MIYHKWQEFGFSPPFRLVGVFTMPSRSFGEANPSAYNKAIGEMPRGCGVGTCGICGTSLVNNFILQDANGVRFSVGCDCVEKHGDSRLISEVDAHKKKVAREMRLVARRKAKQVKHDAYMAVLDAQRTRNGGMTDDEIERQNRENAEASRTRKVLDLVFPIADILHRQNGDFCRSLTAQLNDGRVSGISPQALAIIDGICVNKGLMDATDRINLAKTILL